MWIKYFSHFTFHMSTCKLCIKQYAFSENMQLWNNWDLINFLLGYGSFCHWHAPGWIFFLVRSPTCLGRATWSWLTGQMPSLKTDHKTVVWYGMLKLFENNKHKSIQLVVYNIHVKYIVTCMKTGTLCIHTHHHINHIMLKIYLYICMHPSVSLMKTHLSM